MNRALLIVDVQNDFVSGSLGSEYAQKTVVPNVMKLAKQFNREDIYATLDTHYKDYLSTLEGKKLPVEHCIGGTWGHNLVPAIDELITDYHKLCKITFGASPMALALIFKEYDEIHICGLCTDICIVSNTLILKALFPEKRIVVHTSACGGTSKENHIAAIQTMICCQIDIEE